MHDAYFWIMFFGPPLVFLAVTAFVFRPTARQYYADAKRAIFSGDEPALRVNKSRPDSDN